jgi:hypothetical protein
MKFVFGLLLFFTSCIGQNLNEMELKQQLEKYGLEENWSKSKEM